MRAQDKIHRHRRCPVSRLAGPGPDGRPHNRVSLRILPLLAYWSQERNKVHDEMTDQNQIIIDLSDPLMTPEEESVWDVLRHCRGKAGAILGPTIAERTRIGYKRVQKIVSDLVCHHRKLIGSGTMGYYIPVNDDEVKDAAHYLRHRAIVALHRASEMQRTSLDEVYGQAKIEYEAG